MCVWQSLFAHAGGDALAASLSRRLRGCPPRVTAVPVRTLTRMADRNREQPQAPRTPDRADPRSHSEKHHEREKLVHDPNLNQAGNWRGSLDQTQGSQTGNDIDPVPEP